MGSDRQTAGCEEGISALSFQCQREDGHVTCTPPRPMSLLLELIVWWWLWVFLWSYTKKNNPPI